MKIQEIAQHLDDHNVKIKTSHYSDGMIALKNFVDYETNTLKNSQQAAIEKAIDIIFEEYLRLHPLPEEDLVE